LRPLDDAAFDAASDVTPKFVSQPIQPHRGPTQYADQLLECADKSFDEMDARSFPCHPQAEVGAAKTMPERT